MITKKIRQVTGTSEGITFTKEDKEIENIGLGDLVEVSLKKKVKKVKK